MTTQIDNRTIALPRVNLLPPEIEEARRFRQVQAGLALAVVVALAVVGGLYFMARGDVSKADDQVAAGKAQETQLNTQVAQFADVPLVLGQVEAARAQVEQAMGNEIRWSYFMNDLSLKIPNNIWLTQMSVKQDADAAATNVSAVGGSYLTSGIGSVQFAGKGLGYRDVATWLESLAKQTGYDQPYASSVTREESDGPVTFQSKVSITSDALSGRYSGKAGN